LPGGHPGEWQSRSRGRDRLPPAALRDKERDLATAVVTHTFWGGVDSADRPAARDTLKPALEREDGEDCEDQET
jgi:hypothetical protein